MTNKRNSKKKNSKNDIAKKIDNVESSTEKQMINVLKIIFVVLVFLSAFYLLTLMIVSDDDKNDDESLETAIQYEEILAGSSLTMNDSEYLVVYYDFSDAGLSELSSAISSYNSIGSLRIYTVDMSNGFNSKYVSSDKSNVEPESAKDLLINGPTLIKISDGKVAEYIEGTDEVINYLK